MPRSDPCETCDGHVLAESPRCRPACRKFAVDVELVVQQDRTKQAECRARAAEEAYNALVLAQEDIGRGRSRDAGELVWDRHESDTRHCILQPDDQVRADMRPSFDDWLRRFDKQQELARSKPSLHDNDDGLAPVQS